MGKYSLDAFEAHPLTKLRPLTAAPGADCCRILELYQSELEPKTGELLAPPPVGHGEVVLRLHLAEDADLADADGFIRRMGFCYGGGKMLAGVVMTEGVYSGTALDQLARAYRQGFDHTYALAEPGTGLAEACARAGMGFGLWLPLEQGILRLRRSIAKNNLARNWEKYPVYVYSGRDLTAEELDAACRWHAGAAEIPAVLGARLTLRRMMFPRELTAGGPMPLRMWWQNLGNAPMYRDAEICLELYDGKKRYPILLPEGEFRPGMGDSTVNTTARLPDVLGVFDLRCALRCRGNMLKLAMDAPEENGMYTVGQITLDGVTRPYLATMWEQTYADGYYPLEDPAQPE